MFDNAGHDMQLLMMYTRAAFYATEPSNAAAYAPVEAGLIKLLFQSNALAAFGFVEEILPFTDVVPTFTISWALKNLWPTTPLARRLLPQEK